MKKHNYIYDYIRLIACIFVIGVHVSDGLMVTKTGGGIYCRLYISNFI